MVPISIDVQMADSNRPFYEYSITVSYRKKEWAVKRNLSLFIKLHDAVSVRS